MAMDPSAMADDVIAKLEAAGLGRTPEHKWWQAVCAGIIDHIKTHMDVLPAGLSGPGLQNPAGQTVSVNDPDDGPLVGATTAPELLTGMGSAQ